MSREQPRLSGRGPARIPASRITHRCAAPGCQVHIPRGRLMCRADWFLVPRAIRDRIWRTWDSGAGVLTTEYQQAVADAVAAVKTRKADQQQ